MNLTGTYHNEQVEARGTADARLIMSYFAVMISLAAAYLLITISASTAAAFAPLYSSNSNCRIRIKGPTATTTTTPAQQRRSRSPHSRLLAKPQRLAENADGVLYVNDRCINCAACSGFAPETFEPQPNLSSNKSVHVVHTQPTSAEAIRKARAALAACPVAAIRIETLAERRHGASSSDHETAAAVERAWSDHDQWTVQQMSSKTTTGRPFPRPFLLDEMASTDTSIPGVYWVGHHNEASFGVVPYLLQANHNGRQVWIMVDTPKFSKAAVDDILSVTGVDGAPEYLFLTHVDDIADHGKWAERFPGLKRIFHSGDLGRHNWIGDETLADAEVLLPTVGVAVNNGDSNDDAQLYLTAYTLDGAVLGGDSDWLERFESGASHDDSDVVILHTPGHSPGSITLYKRRGRAAADTPGILFTGDTYAFTPSGGGKMTGFGRYGNYMKQQVETLSRIGDLQGWDVIAPGHGHPRDYRGQGCAVKAAEMKVAQDDLLSRFA